jgi:type VI secretion system secreted protein Hcp
MSRVDYFLKLDGIEGESQDSKHAKEIELQSWSLGATNTGSFAIGAGGGTGKTNVHDAHFTKYSDKSTPKLFAACATGQHIPKGTLTVRKAGVKEGQIEYFKVQLSDVLVSSFQVSGASGNALPHESLSLNFSKIEFEYKEQKADGSAGPVTQAGWDIKKSVKV